MCHVDIILEFVNERFTFTPWPLLFRFYLFEGERALRQVSERVKEREGKQGREGRRGPVEEGKSDSRLSKQPDVGLHLGILGS